MPYISIDLETTGLSLHNSQILQIAAIYDDGTTPIDSLPSYNVYIHEPIAYAELGALVLHEETKIFSKIRAAMKEKKAVTLEKGIEGLIEFILKHRPLREDGSYGRVTLAGKNAGTYDLPLLRRWMTPTQLELFLSIIHHSILDVGSMYYFLFDRIPSLQDILTYLKDNGLIPAERKVSHDALQDAEDVIVAIRSGLQMAV